MKIFVASWFYPPVTTSEALVTYKLFSNSKHEYYVCSASSKQWSYNSDTELKSDNVKQFIIDTDSFDVFIDETIKKYKELSKEIKFDAIMTRSMPPESQKVGLKIKEEEPDIPWIVSLADPIGNNPYETLDNLVYNRHRIVRNAYFHAPHYFIEHFSKYARNPYTKKLGDLAKLEKEVVNKANVVIVPTMEQGNYIMYFNNSIEKCLVVPHSYDKKLYPKVDGKKEDKFVFSFIGHTDKLRSLEPMVRALKLLKELNPEFLDKIHIRLLGNIPMDIQNMIYVFFLQDVISVEGTCNYYESLEIMEKSDCLIHVDANFPTLDNGSIFFAAKIADYLGAGKPIMGITNPNTPAGKIITATGGVCPGYEPMDIAKAMLGIVNNTPKLNKEEAEKYDAVNVAKAYDEELERRILNG